MGYYNGMATSQGMKNHHSTVASRGAAKVFLETSVAVPRPQFRSDHEEVETHAPTAVTQWGEPYKE